MKGPYFVWHMVTERNVWFLVARKMQGDGPTVVSAMVEVRGVSLKGVGIVHK